MKKTTVQMDWKLVYRDLKVLNWLTLLTLSLIGIVFMGPRCTLGIIMGGLVIIANFGLFQRTVRRAFSTEGTGVNRASLIVKYYFRLFGLAAVIFLLLAVDRIDPVGLAIGLSTVVISIVGFGVKRAWLTFFSEAT